MHRGTRQGCPILASLYPFVAEILSDKIKNNELINGFTVKNLEKEIMTLSPKNIDSLKQAIKPLTSFAN